MKIVEYKNFDLKLDDTLNKRYCDKNTQLIFKNHKYYCNLRIFQNVSLIDYTKVFHKLIMINAPTGSGKSTLLLTMVREDLIRNPNEKTIIIAPMVNIVSGFKGCDYIDINGEQVSLEVNCLDHNHIGIKTNSRTNILEQFLKRPINTPQKDRLLTCTYQTLCKCYKKLVDKYSKKQLAKLFKDVNLCIDEAHHLLDKEHMNISKRKQTQITSLMYFLMDMGNRIKIVTATPWRGDGHTIMERDRLVKFKVYSHSFYEYLKDDCKNLKGISVSSLFYDINSSYPEAVKSIFEKHGFSRKYWIRN